MEKIALTAQVREKAGKGVARGLRRNQMVPAVLYSHGKSMPISMGNKDVTKILNTEGGEHALINLKLEGGNGGADKLALIKDYQIDPRNGALIHVDLMEVAMNEKVKIPVAVHLTGASIGVKEGGILQHGVREVEVECLPNQIPEHLQVNISELKVNESLHVRDIKVAEGVKILTDGDATVVTIQPPISDAKLEGKCWLLRRLRQRRAVSLNWSRAQERGRSWCSSSGCRGQGWCGRREEAAPKKEATPKKEAAPKK